MSHKKYCIPCDGAVTPAKDGDCPHCGGDLTPIPRKNTREKGDDDGQEYGHPADRLAGRE